MPFNAERERRLAAARYARATMALEGARQTPISMEQIGRFMAGEISIEQAIENARKDYGLPAGK
ncbi:TPA: chromosome segregation protein ParM [Pseudomonas aeruginosa]|uniref:chromosome segregation protein ParM n=1 Tax=Pseudomonas aeruginosa TaxID=287 RepID=UPI0011C40B04|nr:chromosome segregation protein ParM [Pseudomonas aeruginosa]MBH3552942.1 hypothetical protein [Pseudomonas aeruginosa]MCG0477199.1 hypothetical protein [Pseudomonas aeruginosa]MCS8377900.1 hypothetical protein [Pseudomonas aeruginosa]MCT0394269.1 hypothetical protein [Pseudomonas aeruginosa]MCU9192775.1 hypothetical protein [Pseudomonas aeruginosa]